MRAKNVPFLILLIALFLYLIIDPLLGNIPFATTITDLLLTFVLILAIFTVINNKLLISLSSALLLLVLIATWFHLSLLFHLSLIGYLSLLIASYVIYFVEAKSVDLNMICAALSLYLFIGILWATLYSFLEYLEPGSLGGELLQTSRFDMHTFIYFSYTTLTTLGYGDIFPVTLRAASLCQIEAIIGQFFISVLIAQLVGMRVATRIGNPGK